MEPSSQTTTQDPVPVNAPQSNLPKTSGWKISFFVVLVILVLILAGGGYFYFSKVVTQTQLSAGPQNTSTPVASDTWVAVPKNFMGAYTFQYPAGWHIANQWPTNDTDGVTIFIDPDPLNFAPRGGPLSALEITDTSGKPNPDELFSTARNKFKASLTGKQEETLNSDFGSIYHYWGKINVYEQMVDTEGYFFQIQGGPNDLLNKHNIYATTDTNSKYSDILRKIVLSFKKF
jgi:hypothetical protein